METARLAADGASLKEDLLRPAAYALLTKTPERVALTETHISWVFLLERDVVKVKKPVNLGFLDFRTIAQRRAACEAEVELNARLSKNVYLGVVPIRLGADRHAQVGGSGPIVDWAVHMRRLPDAWRADTRARDGVLAARAIDAVAARIATFHEEARSDEETARFGLPDALARNLDENFAQTRDAIGRYLRSNESDELSRWQTAFLRGHAELFLARAAAGRVRDGHGDLRLEHVYLEPSGAVTILDCIEFNERFRFGDVCADVAFLSMDLAEHGRVDLAERLVAKYARASNDFDLYAVVDFYQSYRGYVRGKVAAMLADDVGADSATRSRAASEARRYFMNALAASHRPLLLPAVVAVGGVIASGKSTIAERIADAMSAPIVDADRTRKSMLGVAPLRALSEPAWQGAYDLELTSKVYAEVLRRASVVLASGRPVVLDASFRSAEMRRAARELAAAHGVPFRFVECQANEDLCRARLAQREESRGVSDGRLAIFEAFAKSFEPVDELPSSEHIVLDTAQPFEESEALLRATLDTWPEGFVA